MESVVVNQKILKNIMRLPVGSLDCSCGIIIGIYEMFTKVLVCLQVLISNNVFYNLKESASQLFLCCIDKFGFSPSDEEIRIICAGRQMLMSVVVVVVRFCINN